MVVTSTILLKFPYAYLVQLTPTVCYGQNKYRDIEVVMPKHITTAPNESLRLNGVFINQTHPHNSKNKSCACRHNTQLKLKSRNNHFSSKEEPYGAEENFYLLF